MTQILASVRSQAEAQTVLDTCEVGVLDMKEPQNGALGALPIEEIAAIQKLAKGRCTTSATVGDLPPDPDVIVAAIERTMECGVDYIKVGLFGGEYLGQCLPALNRIAKSTKLIGVLFADHFEHFDGPCQLLKSAHFHGVMIDTDNKQAGSVFDMAKHDVLHGFVGSAKRLGMICGIAGSIRHNEIASALELAPDYIGFRGALCDDGKREQGISAQALLRVKREFK